MQTVENKAFFVIEVDTMCHRTGGITKVIWQRAGGFSVQTIHLEWEFNLFNTTATLFFSTINSWLIDVNWTEEHAAAEDIQKETAKDLCGTLNLVHEDAGHSSVEICSEKPVPLVAYDHSLDFSRYSLLVSVVIY